MQEILEQLKKRRAVAELGGGEKRIEAQHARGKLTARERIELLLDDGSFEEFDMFVEHRCTDFGMEETAYSRRWRRHRLGHGQRPHRLCVRQGFHRFGGSLSEAHAEKITKVQDMALQNRAPIIGLFDAGGARIQEGVAALAAMARCSSATCSPRA
jgi:propionyl-CoA carboxylase beta chain